MSDAVLTPNRVQAIDQAHSFFAEERAMNQLFAQGKAEPPKDPLANSSGLFSVINFKKPVPAEAQKDLDAASDCMLGLTGLGTSYCQRKAREASNPDLLFDTATWKEVLTHYPMLGPFQFTTSGYQKTIRGVKISADFLEMILGFAVAGPALAPFQAYISNLGKDISIGVAKSDQPFHYAANAVFIDAQKVGNDWKILPHLKMYFIDFTHKESKFYSACLSTQSVDVKLTYIQVDTIWNYALYKNDGDVRQKFDQLVSGTNIKAIEDSKSFFGGSAEKA